MALFQKSTPSRMGYSGKNRVSDQDDLKKTPLDPKGDENEEATFNSEKSMKSTIPALDAWDSTTGKKFLHDDNDGRLGKGSGDGRSSFIRKLFSSHRKRGKEPQKQFDEDEEDGLAAFEEMRYDLNKFRIQKRPDYSMSAPFFFNKLIWATGYYPDLHLERTQKRRQGKLIEAGTGSISKSHPMYQESPRCKACDIDDCEKHSQEKLKDPDGWKKGSKYDSKALGGGKKHDDVYHGFGFKQGSFFQQKSKPTHKDLD